MMSSTLTMGSTVMDRTDDGAALTMGNTDDVGSTNDGQHRRLAVLTTMGSTDDGQH